MANPNLFSATQLFGQNLAGDIAGASSGTLFTCTAGESWRLQSLRLAAKTTASLVMTINFVKAIGPVTEPLLAVTPIAQGTGFEVLTAPFNLMEGDAIAYINGGIGTATGGWILSFDRILP